MLTISRSGMMGTYDSGTAPWYDYRSSINEVVIEDGVTTVGKYAFYYCDNLKKVTIGSSVTGIGNSAFSYCTSLASVDIPDSVTSIGKHAFSYCRSLANVTIGNSVEVIPPRAFFGCEKLKSVTIPASVSYIYTEAFGYYNDEDFGTKMKVSGFTIYGYDGTAAESYANDNGFNFVSLGARPTEVPQPPTDAPAPTDAPTAPPPTEAPITDSGTTGDCTWRLEGGVLTISGNGRMGTYDSVTAPWYGYRSYFDEVVIEDGVTTVGKYAFYDCNMKKVTIGSSVTGIAICAFYFCRSLTSVDIPDSVTIIAVSAFSHCTSLGSVDIGDSVTSIGHQAFYNCTSLANVTIGKSVSDISDQAFFGCEKLKNVTIPASVSSIGSEAFGYYRDEDFGTKMKVSGFTIYGYDGTAAESYANNNGFIFVSLGALPTEAPPEAPTAAPTEAPTQPYNYDLIGDVDNDGEVTSLDITYIQRWLAEYTIPYPVGEIRK